MQLNIQHTEEEGNVDGQTCQYLTFIIGDEEYGVDILSVQEIRGWEETTVIPNAPEHVKGVINLRGTIVPIVDLRQHFGISDPDYDALTVVIVLKVIADDMDRVVGVVVDAVSDVLTLSLDELKPAPDLGTEVDVSFVTGLANVKDSMVIILDINRLLGEGDLNVLNSIDKLQAHVTN